MAAAINRGHGALRTIKWIAGVFAVSSLLPAIAIAANEILATYAFGERILAHPTSIYGSVALVAIATPAVAVLFAGVSLRWRLAGLAAVSLVGGILGLIGGVVCAVHIEWNALVAGSERGGELVAAVERYEAARGDYPKQLSDMVPEFLEAIPETGLRDSRMYDYRPWNGPCPPGNEWHLSISLDYDALRQRRIFYCPRQDHNSIAIDETLKYTTFERVGAWVYEVTDMDD